MAHRQTLLWSVIGLGIFVFVFDLVRRGKLREDFSAFWFAIASAILILVAFPGILNRLAALCGVEKPSNMLFVLGIVFLLGVNVYQSARLSTALKQLKDLAQSVALLHATEQTFPEVKGTEEI
jgi:hypothetical protein